MRQMLARGLPEHDVTRNSRFVNDHLHQVALHAEVLAVNGGLRSEPHRAVVEHGDFGPQRQRRGPCV
jgi:hypothetical protein